jgi:hypothetical protein
VVVCNLVLGIWDFISYHLPLRRMPSALRRVP